MTSEWVKTAKVGDKVVCVQDGNDLPCVRYGDAVPVAGEIYTIREIEVDPKDGDAPSNPARQTYRFLPGC